MHRRAAIWSVTGSLLLLSGLAPPARAGGCHPESPDSSSAKGGQTATVPVKGCEFGPTVIHVPERATVTWVNHDDVPHTVTGTNLTWGGMDEISRGEEARFRFDESGTFPYYCLLHPGMAGAVVVGDGASDDIIAAPLAMPPPSGTKASSMGSTTREDPTGSPTSLPTIALAVLALAAGLGAGIAIKTRGEARPKQMPQT
jgi:plastocyanin